MLPRVVRIVEGTGDRIVEGTGDSVDATGVSVLGFVLDVDATAVVPER
jgi:hypothetical protein